MVPFYVVMAMLLAGFLFTGDDSPAVEEPEGDTEDSDALEAVDTVALDADDDEDDEETAASADDSIAASDEEDDDSDDTVSADQSGDETVAAEDDTTPPVIVDEIFVTGGDENSVPIFTEGETFSGGSGDDTFLLIGNDHFVRGDNPNAPDFAGNDAMFLEGNSTTLMGNAGDDLFELTGDNNRVFAQSGDDIITTKSPSSGAELNGGMGDDMIFAEGDNASIFGGKGDDLIAVNGEDNIVRTGQGSDTVVADDGYVMVSHGDTDTVVVPFDNDDDMPVIRSTGEMPEIVLQIGNNDTAPDLSTARVEAVDFTDEAGHLKDGEAEDAMVLIVEDTPVAILVGQDFSDLTDGLSLGVTTVDNVLALLNPESEEGLQIDHQDGEASETPAAETQEAESDDEEEVVAADESVASADGDTVADTSSDEGSSADESVQADASADNIIDDGTIVGTDGDDVIGGGTAVDDDTVEASTDETIVGTDGDDVIGSGTAAADETIASDSETGDTTVIGTDGNDVLGSPPPEDTSDIDDTDGDSIEGTNGLIEFSFENETVPEVVTMSNAAEALVLPVGDNDESGASFVVEGFNPDQDLLRLVNQSAGQEDGELELEAFAGIDPINGQPIDGTMVSVSGSDNDTIILLTGVELSDEEVSYLISIEEPETV